MNLREVVLTTKTKINKANVKGFEGEVYLKELTVDTFNNIVIHEGKDEFQRQIELIIASYCDEKGDPVFTAADYDAIKVLPINVFEPLLETAQKGLVNSRKAKKN